MYNIGIDGHMIGDKSGGNESYYSNILKEMKLVGDYKIFLMLKEGVDDRDYKNKFNVIYFKSKNPFVRNFIELPILCKKLKLDLLHTQYFIPFWRPCKVVCTIFDICFEHFSDIFTKKEYIRQKLLIPYSAKHSYKIITDSDDAKLDIMKHYKIPANKIVKAYCATNESFKKLSYEQLNENELRAKYEIGDDKFILTVGNLQPRKNMVRLINSFNKLKSEDKFNGKLVIVGKKAWMYNEILKSAISESNDIIFTDYVSNVDLVRLYNAAEIFVYPSYFEGFGIPPLEAMACGTLVAVSNKTSLPEVVGDAGVYFDPFDEEDIKNALYKLISDSKLRNKLVEKMEIQVNKFSWDKSSKIIIDTYKQCLNEK